MLHFFSYTYSYRHIAIGYNTSLDILETRSGALLYHLPGATGIGFLGSMKSYENCGLTKFHKHLSIDAPISSLCYSPQPVGCSRPHLATGLTTGEVKVFEPLSGPLFTLQHPVVSSM